MSAVFARWSMTVLLGLRIPMDSNHVLHKPIIAEPKHREIIGGRALRRPARVEREYASDFFFAHPWSLCSKAFACVQVRTYSAASRGAVKDYTRGYICFIEVNYENLPLSLRPARIILPS